MKKLTLQPTNKNNQGFTLIELMIVVAIIAILTSVAVPMYQDYVQRGYRTEAMQIMQDIMLAQEKYYNDNVTYTTDITNSLGLAALLNNNNRYTFTATGCGGGLAECVQITATPTDADVLRTDGTLTLNSRGQERRTVGAGGNQATYNWKGQQL